MSLDPPTRQTKCPNSLPISVFTTENAHFHFALTTFLTQNAYISALLAALYEISVYEMSIYEMSVYEVSDYRRFHQQSFSVVQR